MRMLTKKYNAAVIGGGLAGIYTAIASARQGSETALLCTRNVHGDNASSEIRMYITSASRNHTNAEAEEAGILNEIPPKNKAANLYRNYSVRDWVLLDTVQETDNLQLRLSLVICFCIKISKPKLTRLLQAYHQKPQNVFAICIIFMLLRHYVINYKNNMLTDFVVCAILSVYTMLCYYMINFLFIDRLLMLSHRSIQVGVFGRSARDLCTENKRASESKNFYSTRLLA